MKKVITCVGTRPNFIKITQLDKFFKKAKIEHKILHTGQHFDPSMSDVFFKELAIKPPDVFFKLSSVTQISIISEIMTKVEQFFSLEKPDLVLVPGDVNSSLACALVANRLGIAVGHIESGLRSGDRTMPEEINRILIDDLSDIYFVTENSGLENLIREGKNKEKIKFVGNTMIDALVSFLPEIQNSKILQTNFLLSKEYCLATFHRPHNVDHVENLTIIVNLINKIASTRTVIFPVHPRTRKKLVEFNLSSILSDNVLLLDPIGYFDFICLIKNSEVCITDSGGIQEETTFLKVPCITVRPNTERPITVDQGTNKLLPLDVDKILSYYHRIVDEGFSNYKVPQFWDGKSSERIVEEIELFFK